MKHLCGGEIDFVWITKIDTGKVEVYQFCTGCGESQKSIQYLYEDKHNLNQKEK